ncbi:MAG TPA: type III pantothenate kinase [Pirellulales bacterium]|nr:type III pantothenate kinase [Pirellulales bacterium]
MTDARQASLAAVDIGNSRIKVGLFAHSDVAAAPSTELPRPSDTFSFLPDAGGLAGLAEWLAPYAARDLSWWIGSVERTFATRLLDWLRSAEASQVVLLSSSDLPLTVSLPRPDMVGIDRLLDAVGANRLRPSGQPAIVVDLGTAITVDLVSARGAFQGGAIMPGIAMSTRALDEFTDLLPLIDMVGLAEPPPALGADTVAAMRSGLFWGAIGGIRQLIAEMSTASAGAAQVYLTGGAAASVASLVAPGAAYCPHLTLAAIALVANEARNGSLGR